MNTRISISKLKVAKFASEETLCFEATVLLDGNAFATASNDGHGGCTFIRPISRATEKQLDEASAYAKSLPDVETEFKNGDGSAFVFRMDLEHLIDELVNETLTRREMEARYKRTMKKAAIFIKDGKVWTSKPRDPTVLRNPAFFDLIRKNHPQAIILNTLPLAQAVEAYIAAMA
jgi:hypothetical protein